MKLFLTLFLFNCCYAPSSQLVGKRLAAYMSPVVPKVVEDTFGSVQVCARFAAYDQIARGSGQLIGYNPSAKTLTGVTAKHVIANLDAYILVGNEKHPIIRRMHYPGGDLSLFDVSMTRDLCKVYRSFVPYDSQHKHYAVLGYPMYLLNHTFAERYNSMTAFRQFVSCVLDLSMLYTDGRLQSEHLKQFLNYYARCERDVVMHADVVRCFTENIKLVETPLCKRTDLSDAISSLLGTYYKYNHDLVMSTGTIDDIGVAAAITPASSGGPVCLYDQRISLKPAELTTFCGIVTQAGNMESYNTALLFNKEMCDFLEAHRLGLRKKV